MAKHDIWITFPAKRMKNVDTTIEIWSGKTKLGTLELSKGGVDWTPVRKQTAKSIEWEDLAKWLDYQWEQ